MLRAVQRLNYKQGPLNLGSAIESIPVGYRSLDAFITTSANVVRDDLKQIPIDGDVRTVRQALGMLVGLIGLRAGKIRTVVWPVGYARHPAFLGGEGELDAVVAKAGGAPEHRPWTATSPCTVCGSRVPFPRATSAYCAPRDRLKPAELRLTETCRPMRGYATMQLWLSEHNASLVVDMRGPRKPYPPIALLDRTRSTRHAARVLTHRPRRPFTNGMETMTARAAV